jgi:hypothetical protein
MKRAIFTVARIAAVAAASLLSSCKSSGVIARVTDKITTPEGGKAYVVATEKTAFYRYGPQQGSGPDGELPKDTVVKLIRNSFGFSKVQVPSTGQQGFVASEDIMPATPTLLAALSTPPPVTSAVAATQAAPASENFDVRSTDSSYVPPPEELPPPDLPPASAESTPQ